MALVIVAVLLALILAVIIDPAFVRNMIVLAAVFGVVGVFVLLLLG